MWLLLIAQSSHSIDEFLNLQEFQGRCWVSQLQEVPLRHGYVLDGRFVEPGDLVLVDQEEEGVGEALQVVTPAVVVALQGSDRARVRRPLETCLVLLVVLVRLQVQVLYN